MRSIALPLSVVLALGGCGNEFSGPNCDVRPVLCALLAVGAVAAVVAIADSGNSGGDGMYEPPTTSDARLKTDIRPYKTLDSGVRLYTFHYLGSTGTFIGPVAQDLLADPRFAGAVSVGSGGFYVVDLQALGLRVVNREAMAAAGENAVRLAGK